MLALVMHCPCRKASCAQHSSGCTAEFCGAWGLAPLACTGSHASGMKHIEQMLHPAGPSEWRQRQPGWLPTAGVLH